MKEETSDIKDTIIKVHSAVIQADPSGTPPIPIRLFLKRKNEPLAWNGPVVLS
jgi:hypothetical protein